MNNKLTKILFLTISLILILFSCSNPVNENETQINESDMELEDGTSRGIPTPVKPFPQCIIDYDKDMAKPDGLSNDYMNGKINDYYDKWKSEYFVQGILPSGYPKDTYFGIGRGFAYIK